MTFLETYETLLKNINENRNKEVLYSCLVTQYCKD